MLGVPYDAESSFLRGAAGAPPLIIAELYSPAYNLCAENGLDLGGASVLRYHGEVDLADGPDPRAAISRAVASLLDEGALPLLLGGDHAVTYPAVRAFAARIPGLSIVHVDAHPDLYDEFEGNRFSHACPFARIMEEGLATQLIQIGIRAATAHQREQAARFGVRSIAMRDFTPANSLNVAWPVYLSVDLDALDPAFAPGVSHREPGGMSVRELLSIVRQLEGRLVGADIVEYNPRVDVDRRTAVVGAKILKEVAAAMLSPAPMGAS